MEKQYLNDQALMGVQDTLSLRRYNVTVGLHLIYGIAVTGLLCMMLGTYMTGVYIAHPLMFTIGFLVLSIAGSYVARNGSYLMSLLGYTLTVVGFGGMLATILPFYTIQIIFGAAIMTLIVLVVMTAAAVIMPNAFLSLGKVLFVSILGLIVAELAALLFGFYNNDLFSMAGIFIFSLYIGYDWSKGQKYPKTSAFAVLTAMELYMDIINIFIRLLSITGRRSD